MASTLFEDSVPSASVNALASTPLGALIMGEARGADMAAVAESGLEICEIAPRKVKQSIVGYGNAQKLAVAKMVQRMLALEELPAPDAADALALALTYAHLNKRFAIDPTQKI